MATNASTSVEGTDASTVRGPINHVGVDGDGAAHAHAPYEDTVWVVQGGEVVHTEHLGGRTIHDWIDYVRAERGSWQTCRYHESAGDAWQTSVDQLQTLVEEAEYQ